MGDEKKKSSGTVAIKILDTQELNLVVQDGRGSAIKMRSILKRFGIPQNKETFLSPSWSCCGIF